MCIIKRILAIIIDGKIPYFKFIKKYLVYISLLSFTIFLNPKDFVEYSKTGWNILVLILLLSPISKIFPKFKIFTKIMILRRALGIITGSLFLAHIIGFIIINQIDIISFTKKYIFNYKSFFFWGMWGAIFMIIPFITSNNISQKILKRKWRIVQKLTYFVFIFGSVHIYLIRSKKESLILVGIWILLKLLEYKKIRLI